MSKGKQKGYKKDSLEIRDEVLNPFYIVKDDRQFIVMRDGNTLPQGYYNKLSYALDSIVKSIHLNTNAGSALSIRQFISSYEEVSEKITNSIAI